MRGTFANIRIRNRMVPEIEGGFTLHLPDGEPLPIYDAAMKYQAEGVPTVVLAGKEYGTGSSRDWAAKGPLPPGRAGGDRRELRAHPPQQPGGHGHGAAGVHAAERRREPGPDRPRGLRHRRASPTAVEAKLRGRPRGDGARPTGEDGKVIEFKARVRLDTPQEVLYYRHGGILHYVLRQLLAGKASAS